MPINISNQPRSDLINKICKVVKFHSIAFIISDGWSKWWHSQYNDILWYFLITFLHIFDTPSPCLDGWSKIVIDIVKSLIFVVELRDNGNLIIIFLLWHVSCLSRSHLKLLKIYSGELDTFCYLDFLKGSTNSARIHNMILNKLLFVGKVYLLKQTQQDIYLPIAYFFPHLSISYKWNYLIYNLSLF